MLVGFQAKRHKNPPNQFISYFKCLFRLDQASFIIKPAQVEPIPLPTPQEAVVEIIVSSVHQSLILEESEAMNSDSSKMEIESRSVELGAIETNGHQDDAQPEAKIVVNQADEVAAEGVVLGQEKKPADLEVEVKSHAVEVENTGEISEGLAKLTLDKEDSAAPNQSEKTFNPHLF